MMREAIRLSAERIRPGMDYVFVARRTINSAGFQQVHEDILGVLEKKDCLLLGDVR